MITIGRFDSTVTYLTTIGNREELNPIYKFIEKIGREINFMLAHIFREVPRRLSQIEFATLSVSKQRLAVASLCRFNGIIEERQRQDIPEGFATQKLEKFSTTISFVFVKNLSVPGEP